MDEMSYESLFIPHGMSMILYGTAHLEISKSQSASLLLFLRRLTPQAWRTRVYWLEGAR